WVDANGAPHPIPLAKVEILQGSPGNSTPVLDSNHDAIIVHTLLDGNYTATIPAVDFPQGGSLQVFAQIDAESQFAKVVQNDPQQTVYSRATPAVPLTDGGTVTLQTPDVSQFPVNVNGAFSATSAIVEGGTYVTTPQDQGGLGAKSISQIVVFLQSANTRF